LSQLIAERLQRSRGLNQVSLSFARLSLLWLQAYFWSGLSRGART